MVILILSACTLFANPHCESETGSGETLSSYGQWCDSLTVVVRDLWHMKSVSTTNRYCRCAHTLNTVFIHSLNKSQSDNNISKHTYFLGHKALLCSFSLLLFWLFVCLHVIWSNVSPSLPLLSHHSGVPLPFPRQTPYRRELDKNTKALLPTRSLLYVKIGSHPNTIAPKENSACHVPYQGFYDKVLKQLVNPVSPQFRFGYPSISVKPRGECLLSKVHLATLPLPCDLACDHSIIKCMEGSIYLSGEECAV